MDTPHSAPHPKVTCSHPACVAVAAPAQQPGTMLHGGCSLSLHEQIHQIALREQCHAALAGQFTESAARGECELTCPRIQKASEIAHAELMHLLSPDHILRLDPSDIVALAHELTHLALQHVKGLPQGADVCHTTLSKSIHASPKIKQFKDKHLTAPASKPREPHTSHCGTVLDRNAVEHLYDPAHPDIIL